MPGEKRLVLIFANVSDQPVTAQLDYDTRPYGLVGPDLSLRRIAPDGPGDVSPTPPVIAREVTFPPRTVWAWEVQ